MLKTMLDLKQADTRAYHLGEGRVLKTIRRTWSMVGAAYHLGEGRVLKTKKTDWSAFGKAYHLGEGRVLKTWGTY